MARPIFDSRFCALIPVNRADHFFVIVPDLYSRIRKHVSLLKNSVNWRGAIQAHYISIFCSGLPVFSGYVNQQFNIYWWKRNKGIGPNKSLTHVDFKRYQEVKKPIFEFI